MTVRRATAADLPVLEALWRTFVTEVPGPEYEEEDTEQELDELRHSVENGLGFLAEDDDGIVGMALALRRSPTLARLTGLYVRPEARRRGVAKRLMQEVVSAFAVDGFEAIDLELMTANVGARAVYTRWGFREEVVTLVAPLDVLAERLGRREEGGSFGSIHVQTDDGMAVVRAVEIYVPRLPGSSRGSIVTPPRAGYVSVYDDVCDRDPSMLRRLAKQISTRMGVPVVVLGIEVGAVVRMILFDRGGIVDEYASVPEYHGSLPPGEVVALAANPVVIERYTGADQSAVRAAAPNAATPAQLPPPRELLAGLAAAMGIEGALHGWADAPEISGATRLDR